MTPLVIRVYDRLIEAAQRGEPCPTAIAMAEQFGVRHTQTHRSVRTLTEKGLIQVEFSGHQRRITILASGDRTDWTDVAQYKRAAGDDEPEDAQRRDAGLERYEEALDRVNARFDDVVVPAPGVLRRLAPMHHSPTSCAFAHLARSG